jgi:hypothetical protein
MLTLKIMHPWSTQWVAGVRSVTELESAHLPSDFNSERDYALDHFTVLRRAGLPGPDSDSPRSEWPFQRAWQGAIHVGAYEPDTTVKAVLVEIEGGLTHTYIVPSGCTWLLGPDGANVDRL